MTRREKQRRDRTGRYGHFALPIYINFQHCLCTIVPENTDNKSNVTNYNTWILYLAIHGDQVEPRLSQWHSTWCSSAEVKRTAKCTSFSFGLCCWARSWHTAAVHTCDTLSAGCRWRSRDSIAALRQRDHSLTKQRSILLHATVSRSFWIVSHLRNILRQHGLNRSANALLLKQHGCRSVRPFATLRWLLHKQRIRQWWTMTMPGHSRRAPILVLKHTVLLHTSGHKPWMSTKNPTFETLV